MLFDDEFDDDFYDEGYDDLDSEENYDECDECGDTVHVSQLRYVETGFGLEERLCRSCRDDDFI